MDILTARDQMFKNRSPPLSQNIIIYVKILFFWSQHIHLFTLWPTDNDKSSMNQPFRSSSSLFMCNVSYISD